MKPPSVIFKNCLQTWTFPNNWKKSNVVPIHKKGASNIYKITAQIHCCQYVVKFLKIFIFKPLLEFLEESSLLCPHQSGFCSFYAGYYPLFMTPMLVLIKVLPFK